MKNIFLVASAAASLCLMTALGAAAESGVKPVARTAAESKVMSVCQKCHGPQGDSVSPIFPRLNAQQADYIVAQLKSLRIHKRKDTRAQYMGGIARELDDTMMAGLAKYFAGQKPTQPQTGGALAAEGEKNLRERRPRRRYLRLPTVPRQAWRRRRVDPADRGPACRVLQDGLGSFPLHIARERNDARRHEEHDRPRDRGVGVVPCKRLTPVGRSAAPKSRDRFDPKTLN